MEKNKTALKAPVSHLSGIPAVPCRPFPPSPPPVNRSSPARISWDGRCQVLPALVAAIIGKRKSGCQTLIHRTCRSIRRGGL